MSIPIVDKSTEIDAINVETQKIGSNTDSASMSDTLFAGQQAIFDGLSGSSGSTIILEGSCDSGMSASTTTIVSADLADKGDDFFNNHFWMQVIKNANSVTSAPENEYRLITDYVSTTGTFTTESFSANVEENDKILIIHESQYYNINKSNSLKTTDKSLIEKFKANEEIDAGDLLSIINSYSSTGDVYASHLNSDLTYNTDTNVLKVFDTGDCRLVTSVYDSVNERVVIVYYNNAVANGYAVVGELISPYANKAIHLNSSEYITFGTPVVFHAVNCAEITTTFDSVNGNVVIAYKNATTSNYGYSVVGTVNPSDNSISFGTPVVFESSTVSYLGSAFDSVNEKVVIGYNDYAIVGTVSGTSILFGTAVDTGETMGFKNIVYDSTNGKIVIGFRDSAASGHGAGIVGTVSGTSISFGTPTTFDATGGISDIGGTFDSVNDKVVFAYKNTLGYAVVGTVSGTSISFGAAYIFVYGDYCLYTSCDFDPINGTVVIGYSDHGNSTYGTAVVGTVSGAVISFGRRVVFESATIWYTAVTYDSSNETMLISYMDNGSSNYGTSVLAKASGTDIVIDTYRPFNVYTSTFDADFVYDSSNEKVVIAYKYVNRGYVVVGTLSGTGIIFGTPAVFSGVNDLDDISITYDSSNERVVISYRDTTNSNYGTSVVGEVSGTSISFGTPVVFRSNATTYISSIYDPNNKNVIISFNIGNGYSIVGEVNSSDNSISFGTAVQFEAGTSVYISSIYDSINEKVVISYADGGDSNKGKSIIGTVSGIVISFGTAVEFEANATTYISSTYDQINEKVVISYQVSATTGEAIVGTVSGNSISFGSAVSFDTDTITLNSAVFDTVRGNIIITYNNTTDSHTYLIVGTVSGTAISFGTREDIFSLPINKFVSTLTIGNKLIITCNNYDGATYYYGNVFPYFLIPSRKYIIAQNSASIDEEFYGRIIQKDDIDNSMTNRIPGTRYYNNCGIGISPSEVLFTKELVDII